MRLGVMCFTVVLPQVELNAPPARRFGCGRSPLSCGHGPYLPCDDACELNKQRLPRLLCYRRQNNYQVPPLVCSVLPIPLPPSLP